MEHWKWQEHQKCAPELNINLIYHWFLERIKSKRIKIYHISTEDYVTDIFTKPLPVKTFVKHREHILHW